MHVLGYGSLVTTAVGALPSCAIRDCSVIYENVSDRVGGAGDGQPEVNRL